MQAEKDRLGERNAELELKVEAEAGVREHESEIKSRVEALLSKVDDVVGS